MLHDGLGIWARICFVRDSLLISNQRDRYIVNELKCFALVGCVDPASGHLNSSDKAPGSRRRNENGKVERLGARLRRRNDSSVNTICRACRHSMCS